jgi:hypothetical protein
MATNAEHWLEKFAEKGFTVSAKSGDSKWYHLLNMDSWLSLILEEDETGNVTFTLQKQLPWGLLKYTTMHASFVEGSAWGLAIERMESASHFLSFAKDVEL